MALAAVAFVAAMVFAIMPKQASQVTLLPEADGKVGAVIVTSTRGDEQRLTSAFGTASVSNRGTIGSRTDTESQVRALYGTTLDARPHPPVSFTVYFEFGSAVDIRPSLQPMLEQLRAALPQYPAPEISVIGHTDRVGTLESNDTLSLQRATTVRNAMVEAGVDPAIISVAGRGEREPLVPTADEVAEQKNRRVEVNLR